MVLRRRVFGFRPSPAGRRPRDERRDRPSRGRCLATRSTATVMEPAQALIILLAHLVVFAATWPSARHDVCLAE
jgi:hypothetical protein